VDSLDVGPFALMHLAGSVGSKPLLASVGPHPTPPPRTRRLTPRLDEPRRKARHRIRRVDGQAAGSTGYQIDANLDRFDAPRARQATKPKPTSAITQVESSGTATMVGSAVKLCATPPASV
jgi:hypothetical protein